MATSKRSFYAAMAEELALRSDDDLLDVGCGCAGLLAEQAAHVRYVAGLDVSDIQVDIAVRRLSERITAGTAEVIKGDAGALPWEDGRFSVVTSLDSMKYFPDPAAAAREIHRVLRPGGRAVLMLGERIAGSVESGTLDAWGQWQWSQSDAQQLMEEAGFAETSISFLARGGRLASMAPDAQLVRGVKSI